MAGHFKIPNDTTSLMHRRNRFMNYSELALISSSKTCVISRIFRIANRRGVAFLVSNIPNTPLYVVRQKR